MSALSYERKIIALLTLPLPQDWSETALVMWVSFNTSGTIFHLLGYK